VTATTKKDRTVAIQKSLETGERFPLSYFDSRQYIQHNLAIGDGLGSLLAFLDQLPANTTKVRPIRTFEDGDISFAHLSRFTGGKTTASSSTGTTCNPSPQGPTGADGR
jgi:predicted SnoaL-like aldol condensation-catalyzing enzyme